MLGAFDYDGPTLGVLFKSIFNFSVAEFALLQSVTDEYDEH